MLLRQVDKLRSLVRHIRHVQDNAILLAERLIDQGEAELGRTLVANALYHDHSKFYGGEWENLVGNEGIRPELLKNYVDIHNTTNPHHPEYWCSGIHGMSKIFLAEMVCDWKARSGEFGTSMTEWITNVAMPRYKFTADDQVYKTIIKFLNLLLEPPFKPVE